MNDPTPAPITCDTCGEPVGDYVQHAIDADTCSDRCTDQEIKRRENSGYHR